MGVELLYINYHYYLLRPPLYPFRGHLPQSQKGELYETVCNGCPSNCTTCDFKEPDLVPLCISLTDAGIEHANSSGGLSTVEDLRIFEGYWRATTTSTNVKMCYNAAACPGGLTTGKCNTGYKGPCEFCTEQVVNDSYVWGVLLQG